VGQVIVDELKVGNYAVAGPFGQPEPGFILDPDEWLFWKTNGKTQLHHVLIGLFVEFDA